jgi:glutamate/tyrosine decarboxylase-like PLP-dependent enzyme
MTDTKNLQEQMFQAAQRRDLFEQAKGYAYEYMNGVFDRNVFPDEAALAKLKEFDEELPKTPGDPSEMLQKLHEIGSPASVATTGGRYFGFVTGGAFPPVLAAKWLADVWDQNSALNVLSPVSAKLEAISQRWAVDLLRLPPEAVAGFVSGTSLATFVGLAAGRYELLHRAGWDVNAKGLFGAPPLRVVASAEAHGTVYKAVALLGLGKERVELIPVDEQGRIRADQLPALDERTLVVTQAGNVNSGAFDPFDAVCGMAEKAGAWVHVDGAIGLWAAASRGKRHLVQGAERADSWSVDAHKTLNAPYDSGLIFCRHADALVTAISQATGAYIIYSDIRDGMLYTPDMSRRSRAIEMWALLKTIGRSGVEELVDGLCERAQQAAELLTKEGFKILNDVVFNQVLVACETPEQSGAMVKHLQQSGECWCGGSIWQGKPVIRISVSSWATTANDIDRTVAAFVSARAATQSVDQHF